MDRVQGRRLFWEAVVVIVSILTAFALDAWWDSSAARADLRRELDSVAEELEANREALFIRLEGRRGMIASIDDMLLRIDGRGSRSQVEFADSVLYLSFVTSPTTDPSIGGLDALIASGRLAMLRDPELRRFLAGFRNVVEDVREDELGARSVAHDKIFPLFDGTPAGEAAAAVQRRTGGMPTTTTVVDFDAEMWTRVRSNLMLRVFWLSNALEEGEDFLAGIDAAMVALREEIATLR